MNGLLKQRFERSSQRWPDRTLICVVACSRETINLRQQGKTFICQCAGRNGSERRREGEASDVVSPFPEFQPGSDLRQISSKGGILSRASPRPGEDREEFSVSKAFSGR